jgi:hypothetical protein
MEYGIYIRGEYLLSRSNGRSIPLKDRALIESAPQLFNALQVATELLVNTEYRQEAQKMMMVIEQAMRGKKTQNYKAEHMNGARIYTFASFEKGEGGTEE